MAFTQVLPRPFSLLYRNSANLPTACVKPQARKTFFTHPLPFLFPVVENRGSYPRKNNQFKVIDICGAAILGQCGPAGRLSRPGPTFRVEKVFHQITGFLTFMEASKLGCGKSQNEAAQPLVLRKSPRPKDL